MVTLLTRWRGDDDVCGAGSGVSLIEMVVALDLDEGVLRGSADGGGRRGNGDEAIEIGGNGS